MNIDRIISSFQYQTVYDFDKILFPRADIPQDEVVSGILREVIMNHAHLGHLYTYMSVSKYPDGRIRLQLKIRVRREPSVIEIAFYVSLVILGVNLWMFFF